MATRDALTRRQQAHAIRIYGVCKEAGWDITTRQISAITGINRATVGKVIRIKGWDVKHGLIENQNRPLSDDPVELDKQME